jgi:NADPH2:quinone reductase
MKAVAYQTPGALNRPDSLMDIELPEPTPGCRDLVVQVDAVSVNPVDYKIRQNAAPLVGDDYRVLGWDSAGVVVNTGPNVQHYQVGDKVFYAGSLTRAGSNAQRQCVDERLVGKAPTSISEAQAAALPLTSLTAWEGLFDRFALKQHSTGTLLVIGGAGGVGSMVIQLAKALTSMRVIATASRPASQAWVKHCGADFVVDHHQPLAPQLKALATGDATLEAPTHVYITQNSESYLATLADVMTPQGHILLIDDPDQLDIRPLKLKSISVHWEFMFTRAMFETPDMDRQREILNQVSAMIDSGHLRTTLNEELSPISAATLLQAHKLLESGQATGKLVASGW